MSFRRAFEYIIQKDDKSFTNLSFNNGNIEINSLNSNYHINGSYSFVDVDFDINSKNEILGVINNKKNCLSFLRFYDENILTTTIINYDIQKNAIKFPTIKYNNSHLDIFCYLFYKQKKNTCDLIHISKSNNSWKYKVIDTIHFGILSNFVAITNNSEKYIFYYKIINKSEEIFMSTYNNLTDSWSLPTQLTDTHNTKVYLSALKHNDCFHIVFSENIDNKYFCEYINVTADFIASEYTILSDNVACTFPHIIKTNNIIFSQWIEYNDLITRTSIDNGSTWSSPRVNSIAQDQPFLRYIIKSNYLKNKGTDVSTMFALKNSPVPLGINII